MGAVDEVARALERVAVADGMYKLRLRAPTVAARGRPGQFVQLRVSEGYEPLMRLPLSLAGADAAEGEIDVIYEHRGPKTAALSMLRAGEDLACLGPLGHGFTMPETDGAAVLVGGGVGLPPLLFLGETLRAQGIEVVMLAGARTADKHLPGDLLRPAAQRCALATDDGSLGHCGLVTELLAAELADGGDCTVYACGPHAMLRAVAALSAASAVPCQVSLEEYMACGIGICVGCAVAVRPESAANDYARYQRVCTTGPVFDSASIDWESHG
jgi:dihydroorotate dehydrogenase electron transfer subunit